MSVKSCTVRYPERGKSTVLDCVVTPYVACNMRRDISTCLSATDPLRCDAIFGVPADSAESGRFTAVDRVAAQC